MTSKALSACFVASLPELSRIEDSPERTNAEQIQLEKVFPNQSRTNRILATENPNDKKLRRRNREQGNKHSTALQRYGEINCVVLILNDGSSRGSYRDPLGSYGRVIENFDCKTGLRHRKC